MSVADATYIISELGKVLICRLIALKKMRQWPANVLHRSIAEPVVHFDTAELACSSGRIPQRLSLNLARREIDKIEDGIGVFGCIKVSI